MEGKGLAYVGKVVALEPIEKADFIVSATVVCGEGGRWKGVVQKGAFNAGDLCMVYLPDALIQPSEKLKFMEKSGWRVRMQRFRGAPSEVVITDERIPGLDVGTNCTEILKVSRYVKPVPPHLQGKAIGYFPNFIPKTDEEHFQKDDDLIEKLVGHPFYVTLKYDGSSTTAFKHGGKFGLCSRNLELEKDDNNGYWKVANKHNVQRIPEGYALQWETCGPKIQGNRLRFPEICGFAFSGYCIAEKRYLTYHELIDFTDALDFPRVNLLYMGESFSREKLEELKKFDADQNDVEGVVVRSQYNLLGHKPISFKIINLNYEK
jgi:RNA ligase (TIGR02306 family)